MLTYSIIVPVMMVAMLGVYAARDYLLPGDLGGNRAIMAAGLALMVLDTWLFARVKRELPWLTMLGLPELDPQGHPQQLITGGIYSKIRHPRYLQILLGFLGWSLLVNYVSCYVLFILSIPVICFIARIEERELVARFGQEYLDYRRRVPGFIPRRSWL